MSWVANRKTTRKEDKAYCLLGVFGVFMPLIYGEGEEYASQRLTQEIKKRQKSQRLREKTERGLRRRLLKAWRFWVLCSLISLFLVEYLQLEHYKVLPGIVGKFVISEILFEVEMRVASSRSVAMS